MNSMNSTVDSVSPRSTSASSAISEEVCPADLFSNCQNLCFIKKLSDAKFPVYLVSYAETNQLYAMKIFPWEGGVPSTFFTKEVRFAQFSHPNIISMVFYVYEQECSSSDEFSKISYILMDYANYGDFFDVLISYKIPFDDILIRTYFHQLIEAIEALHSQGAAHLDLKLENLLLTDDFTLKITDFDLSYMAGDGKVKTRGTKNFRAPELLTGRCTDPQAADIYSAGIVLFLLKTGGRIPYKEEVECKELDMELLKETNPKRFWEKQCDIHAKKVSFFTEDFKGLFMWMTKRDPEKRPTIAQIKSSRWYRKEIYSKEDLTEFMKTNFETL